MLFLNYSVTGQVKDVVAYQDSIWAQEYQKRIKKKELLGVYIPTHIGDAHRELTRLISPQARQKFMSMTEDQAEHKLFFSLGRWIIVNWGFEGGSRLSHSLREFGLTHPEDMAAFLIVTYHRKLAHRPLNPKPLIERLLKDRRVEWERRRKVTTKIRGKS